MSGLRIKTVTGAKFDVVGRVEFDPNEDIYYCAGSSYPAGIVTEVLYEQGVAS